MGMGEGTAEAGKQETQENRKDCRKESRVQGAGFRKQPEAELGKARKARNEQPGGDNYE